MPASGWVLGAERMCEVMDGRTSVGGSSNTLSSSASADNDDNEEDRQSLTPHSFFVCRHVFTSDCQCHGA
jgi:hypothetical protein